MEYYNLRSIVGATKTAFSMTTSSDSFCIAAKRDAPYIEPTFVKAEFEVERPSVVLVSAVGATGKTTLANVLSNEAGLPLLDLAKHKPVGDNTLTGLLTTSFQTDQLGQVFRGLSDGTFGVIVDGVDEGRSKTTEKAFEAFLDDIARLCSGSPNASFVLLGRTQVLEECWLYLTYQGVKTGLLTIAPFDLPSARNYIDAFADAEETQYRAQYEEARDSILDSLGKAFCGRQASGAGEFLSFIGYPPVLDAIVTLLRKEKNYYRLLEQMQTTTSVDVEVSLLLRIAHYILEREKVEKVTPNILEPLLAEYGGVLEKVAVEGAFSAEEQCKRLVAFTLGSALTLHVIDEQSANDKYEERLVPLLPDHPFLSAGRFRNAIFESVALASLMVCADEGCLDFVLEYVKSHKHNYHLIYILSMMAPDGRIPIVCLHALLGAALEFRSHTATVELRVDARETGGTGQGAGAFSTVDIEVSIVMGEEAGSSKEFVFSSQLPAGGEVSLGSHLSAAFVSLPCEVAFVGEPEIELTAPIEISAESVRLEASALVLGHASRSQSVKHIAIDAETVVSSVQSIVTNGVDFEVAVSDKTGLGYPLIQHVTQRDFPKADPRMREKFLRLKRILQEFRSHGKGTLGKYRHKIEHERVLRNDMGRAILARLISDEILTLEGEFYILHQEEVSEHLGITWLDLRKGRTTDQLLAYLCAIGE